MVFRFERACIGAACALLGLAGSAGAVDIAPHRAAYATSLDTAKPNSGVTGASGTMTNGASEATRMD